MLEVVEPEKVTGKTFFEVKLRSEARLLEPKNFRGFEIISH